MSESELERNGTCTARACHVSKYKGFLNAEDFVSDIQYLRVISFFSNPPETTIIMDEYFIYSFVDILGIFGGTLGLFLGFSLAGQFTLFIDFLKKHI